VAAGEERLVDLAGAILDGSAIDWASAESRADETDRPLLGPLKLLASLADLHRRLSSPGSEAPREGGVEEESIADLRGETVGAYRLIEPLGRGGMGEVYLGERADGRFEQKVAVKLVKRGMDSVEILRRFARERRILARLEHPGIARLLDGGETPDGRPYFVMERVEGESITDYCRARGVALEDRLRLFASCCDAVDAAHRGLVVHRDLKPSNILVTPDGQVKLLDFGIAKLLGEEEGEIPLTRLGERMITPAYAAPEQILGGGVTVATDVFALGIVLYELLTGALPFDRRATTPHELASRVERESVERPSTTAGRTAGADGAGRERQRWARRLNGDLDTITMKALAHEPERRYPSAAAFAEDIRRYLTSRPVEARPDSRGYRLRKFVMRHRLGVAASSVVAAAVIVALVVSLDQTAAARREARRAAAAQAYLTSLFEQVDPGRSAGSAPTVRDLLERGSKRLDKDLAQQPELRAEMDALLGRAFDQLGLPDQGEAHWRRALKTWEALFGPGDARTAKAKKGLAISLARQARYAEAEPLFKELLARAEALGDKRELASMLMNYGQQKVLTGNYAASEALLERAVALLGSAREPDQRALSGALNNLGLAYWRQGRERAAIDVFERSLAIKTKEGPRSGDAALTLHNLSQLHMVLGELDVAERYGQEALALEQALYPPNHPQIGGTLDALGHVAQKRGDRARARALYERSIAIYESSKRPDHPDLAHTLRHLARLSLEEGDTEGAVRLYERALALRRKAFGDRHPEVAESWHDLAVARGRLAPQDIDAALEALRAGLGTLRSTLPADSSLLARELFFLGDVLRLNGRPGEAAPYLEEAQAIWHKKPPSNPRDLGDGSSIADLEAALAATRAAQS
jgi:serine/threonine protein kinase/Tfp pilus assembly protein PilF